MINMFCMPCSDPVRPCTNLLNPLGEAFEPGMEHEGAAAKEEIVDLSQADSKDVIADAEQQDGNGHLSQPLPTPPSMTPAERAQHNISHLPPHRGCPICAANRTPNSPHGQSHEHERLIPLLVGDYCFLRSIQEKHLLTCLVMRLYPYCGIQVPPRPSRSETHCKYTCIRNKQR